MHNCGWNSRSGETRLDVVFGVLFYVVFCVVWLTVFVTIAFGIYKKIHQSDVQENTQTSIVSVYSEDNHDVSNNKVANR